MQNGLLYTRSEPVHLLSQRLFSIVSACRSMRHFLNALTCLPCRSQDHSFITLVCVFCEIIDKLSHSKECSQWSSASPSSNRLSNNGKFKIEKKWWTDLGLDPVFHNHLLLHLFGGADKWWYLSISTEFFMFVVVTNRFHFHSHPNSFIEKVVTMKFGNSSDLQRCWCINVKITYIELGYPWPPYPVWLMSRGKSILALMSSWT